MKAILYLFYKLTKAFSNIYHAGVIQISNENDISFDSTPRKNEACPITWLWAGCVELYKIKCEYVIWGSKACNVAQNLAWFSDVFEIEYWPGNKMAMADMDLLIFPKQIILHYFPLLKNFVLIWAIWNLQIYWF